MTKHRCANHGCELVAVSERNESKGMGTNGQCHCLYGLSPTMRRRVIARIKELSDTIDELREEDD